MVPAFKDVCRSNTCIDLMGKTCEKILPCGHACCGFKDEKECLACLHEDCVSKNEDLTLGVRGDDFCNICYCEGLSQAPCI